MVLIDEFGKGTANVDGQALLAASLDFWINKTGTYLLESNHFEIPEVQLLRTTDSPLNLCPIYLKPLVHML